MCCNTKTLTRPRGLGALAVFCAALLYTHLPNSGKKRLAHECFMRGLALILPAEPNAMGPERLCWNVLKIVVMESDAVKLHGFSFADADQPVSFHRSLRDAIGAHAGEPEDEVCMPHVAAHGCFLFIGAF